MSSRSHIYVRPLRTYDEADKTAFVAAVEHAGKSYPRDVFSLPSTRVMVAERREEDRMEIVMYQPSYVSLVLGSFVGVTQSDVELAAAQHAMTAAAYTRCHTEGFADVICFTKTPDTEGFALRHGFIPTHTGLRMEVR